MILKVGDTVCTVYGIEVVIVSIRDNEIEALSLHEAKELREKSVKHMEASNKEGKNDS